MDFSLTTWESSDRKSILWVLTCMWIADMSPYITKDTSCIFLKQIVGLMTLPHFSIHTIKIQLPFQFFFHKKWPDSETKIHVRPDSSHLSRWSPGGHLAFPKCSWHSLIVRVWGALEMLMAPFSNLHLWDIGVLKSSLWQVFFMGYHGKSFPLGYQMREFLR